MLSRSAKMPPHGEFVMSCTRLSLRISRITFDQIVNGNRSEEVWLLEKSAKYELSPPVSGIFSSENAGISFCGCAVKLLKSAT